MEINSSVFYADYTVYKSFKKKEGRFYVTMVHKITKKHRIMAYARYKMSSHLGRELRKDEIVDHKNEIKLDDDISNLQILTHSENIKKNKDHRGICARLVTIECSFCLKEIVRQAKRVRRSEKIGSKNYFCDKQCESKFRTGINPVTLLPVSKPE